MESGIRQTAMCVAILPEFLVSDQGALFRRKGADHWLELRTNGNDDERWEAVDAIRHICNPNTSIPLFVDTLRRDSYWRARALAAHAIYDLAWDAAYRLLIIPIMPDLIASLGDSSEHVRHNVVMTLELLGPAAIEALPTLQEILREADSEFSELVRIAVVAIEA